MRNLFLIAVLFVQSFTSFSQSHGISLELKSMKELKKIPSASGIVRLKDHYFIIGDDSPWLFETNSKFKIKKKILIFPSGKQFERIPKEMKPDFEALAIDQSTGTINLLIFGSGSKSPQRDVLVKSSTLKDHETQIFSMNEFYDKMRAAAGLKKHELNIEGAVLTGGMLFLFDRSNNYLFVYKWEEIEQYLKDYKICPNPKVYHVNLPKLQGFQSTFSGATAAFEGNKIIFTASVENTRDSYHDGEIMGSFVGSFNLLNLKDGLTPYCELIKDENGEPLKIKAESVCLQKQAAGNQADLVVVTDSDGGISQVMEIKLQYLFR